MGILSELKPKDVFMYFEQLCSVPHGSHNTKIISDLLVAFAKEHSLRYRQDELNNVIIFKDATAGYENAPTYIIQGHMDMVCTQTPDCTKDMATEGLDVMTDGSWVWADKTSLGGDDCIAVAIAMAILADDSLKHPALEAVITVDEEVGMDGAFGLDCSDLKGKRLLNLDSEEEGVFTVSCAGGCRMDSLIPASYKNIPDGYIMAKLSASGFLGGHSGADIADGRASAITTLGKLLFKANKGNMLLVSANGGKFDNVICSTAECIVAVPSNEENELLNSFNDFSKDFGERYELIDPNAGITFEILGDAQGRAYDAEDTKNILSVWSNIPQGVQEMLVDFEGIPKTSLNIGIVSTDEEGFHFTHSIRSSVKEEKEALVSKLSNMLDQVNGIYSLHGVYPSWPFVKSSSFRDLAVNVYKEINGIEPGLAATHGGLECGLFIDKIPGLDAISLGPELNDIHSVREKLSVNSTEKLYNFVCKLLEESK